MLAKVPNKNKVEKYITLFNLNFIEQKMTVYKSIDVQTHYFSQNVEKSWERETRFYEAFKFSGSGKKFCFTRISEKHSMLCTLGGSLFKM